MTGAGRLAIGLGAVNLVTLVLVAVVSAGQAPRTPDRLPAGALPVSEVARRVEGDGATRILRIEADRGDYHIQAVDPAGRPFDLRVDPVSGAVKR